MLQAVLTLAQSSSSSQDAAGLIAGLFGLAFFGLFFALFILLFVALWKVFVKAGQPGWAAIIPFYNLYILTKIVGRPWWWLLLFIIPFVGFIFLIILYLDVAKSFGRSTLFGVGLVLLTPIFICILGFGRSQYLGPTAAK